MAGTRVTTTGRITTDGRLELDRPLCLPPGRVTVTMEQTEDSPREHLSIAEVLAWIKARQAERGFTGRSCEELDRELAALRDEWDA